MTHSRSEIKLKHNAFPGVKIKWLRTSLKFFWYYCILENLSPGDETAATLVTSYFLLFLLIHAPTTQSILQT